MQDSYVSMLARSPSLHHRPPSTYLHPLVAKSSIDQHTTYLSFLTHPPAICHLPPSSLYLSYDPILRPTPTPTPPSPCATIPSLRLGPAIPASSPRGPCAGDLAPRPRGLIRRGRSTREVSSGCARAGAALHVCIVFMGGDLGRSGGRAWEGWR